MERIHMILQHPMFKECVEQNEMAEAQRCFCHHDIEHLLSVARIGMLLIVDEKLEISKEVMYAAALLHDCGRYRQYKDETPHEEAGAKIAGCILPECAFSREETEQIVAAIDSHRGSLEKDRKGSLAEVLYRADKMSRNCQFCKEYQECNWPKERKDRMLQW